MGWRRLPTLLAHVPLRTLPLSEQAQKTLEQTGHLSELAFKTIPRIGKFEVKNFLQSVYGLDVVRVRTANHEGAKKRNKQGTFYRRPDWKKVYVTLKPQQAAGTTPQ